MRRVFQISASLFLTALVSFAAQAKVVIVGPEQNLYSQLLGEQKVQTVSAGSITEALSLASKGDGVVVLAVNYPEELTSISKSDYSAFSGKGVRLYVEYPEVLPNGDAPKTYMADLERGVVTSTVTGLPKMSIVGINGCHLVVAAAKNPMLVLAKIAGYDTAVFGLKDVEACYPVLYRDGSVLVATTSLSNCVEGRYGPAASWERITSCILGYVSGKRNFSVTSFPVTVAPSYSAGDVLPQDASLQATAKAAQWLWNANLFIHPTWEKPLLKKYQPVGGDPNRFFGEPVTDDMLQGDGCRGIMEGHASSVNEKGIQEYRYFVRADVHGESSFLLASAGDLTGDPVYDQTAEKLLDYLFYTSCFRDNERSDRKSDAYGLLGWANTAPEAFFNDDNARCILGAIGASALMDNQRWNNEIVENILSNFRLASNEGFIGSCLWQKEILEHGWKWYSQRENYLNPSPHFESYMWALYLWLFEHTGYQPLFNKAKAGISNMMELYPNWLVQNGIQQERARMILPLAWLVRVEDNAQNREWLDIIVRKFLENQDTCGAIREELGSSESDHNNLLISSNSEYGKNEASLIAKNGDPVADMLYTCNFGFFALNEASKATGKYTEEVKRLADFLVRIQVKSDVHKDLDGAWFRAFDFGRWDYWASNADNGWGAWCTLCGWIETWIGVTEYLVGNKTSYWDVTGNMNMTSAMNNALWMLDKE